MIIEFEDAYFNNKKGVIMCEHKWIYQGSDYKERRMGHLSYELSRIDTYYCEKCLEIKEINSKKEEIYRGDSYPYWWKK